MSFRREQFISGCHCAALAVPCYALTWALDGDEPVIAQFRNGVGLADVIGAVAALAAYVLFLMTVGFFLGAALGEKWETGE